MASDIELERLQRSLVSPPNTSGLSKLIHRRVRRAHTYHTTENLHINRLIRVAEDPTATRLLDDRPDTSAFHIKAAIYLSIYGTIIVAVLQIYAAATTRSLSLFVTMAESCCEAVSNIGLDYLHRKSRKLSNSTRWPAGAGRLCNAGNICFAFALMAVSLVLVPRAGQQRPQAEQIRGASYCGCCVRIRDVFHCHDHVVKRICGVGLGDRIHDYDLVQSQTHHAGLSHYSIAEPP